MLSDVDSVPEKFLIVFIYCCYRSSLRFLALSLFGSLALFSSPFSPAVGLLVALLVAVVAYNV